MNNNEVEKSKKITFELREDYAIALKNYCRNTGTKQGKTIEILVMNFINSLLDEEDEK